MFPANREIMKLSLSLGAHESEARKTQSLSSMTNYFCSNISNYLQCKLQNINDFTSDQGYTINKRLPHVEILPYLSLTRYYK